jgi:hypothetical protein
MHDTFNVFYEPRFILLIIPLALIWLMGCTMQLPTRLPTLVVSAGLLAVFLWTDVQVIKPHVSPYRPARADIIADLASRSDKIVIHPGYLVGCWPLPSGFEASGRIVVSDTGAMVGVEKQMALENAQLYSPTMSWRRFRAEIVKGESFTVIQGLPAFYPRQQVSFVRPDDPWETDYRCRRLWPNHPFVTVIRFERTP